MDLLAFGEFIASNNFFLLLTRTFDLVNKYIELGAYQQGVPLRPVSDFVWGTNSGLRSLPVLAWLTTLDAISPGAWEYCYLVVTLLLSFVFFLVAIRLIRPLTVFAVVGAIFYSGNLWIIDRLFSGYWQLNLVYSLIPLLIAIPVRVADRSSWTWRSLAPWSILYALSASVITVAQPHFVIIAGVFAGLHLVSVLLTKPDSHTLNLLKLYGMAGCVFLVINSYQFIPGLLYPERRFTAPNQYFSLNAVGSNGSQSQLYNVLKLETVWWPAVVFKWSTLDYLQLLPILLTLMLFIVSRRRSWLMVTCLLVFVFLAKGINPPAVGLSKWVYENVPIMHFFRDPTRFLAGVVLFMSFIMAEFEPRRFVRQWWNATILAVALSIVLLVNWRNVTQPRVSYFTRTHIPASYAALQTYVDQRLAGKNDGRLLPLPDFQGMSSYSWYKTPLPLSMSTPFDMLVPLAVPLTSTTPYPDSYSNQLTAYLYGQYTQQYNPRLLTPLVVRYLVTDSAAKETEAGLAVATRSAMTLAQNSAAYRQRFAADNLRLFEMKTPGQLVTTQRPLFAVGDLNTIARSYIAGGTRPVVLLNQSVNSEVADLSVLDGEDLESDVNNPERVLAAERLAPKYDLDILKAGWEYDQIFANFEPSKLSYIQTQGDLFTSGRSVVSQNRAGFMHIERTFAPGRYRILLKALTDATSSSLMISVGGTDRALPLDTEKRLIWIDGGTINLSKSATFVTLTKADSSLTVIDHLALVPDDRYKAEVRSVERVLDRMHRVSGSERSSVGPEHYTIQGEDAVVLDRSSKYLTYRFSYGDHWKSDRPATKFMSDLYGMTFVAPGNETLHAITYPPNKAYKASLLVSVIAVVLCLALLIVAAHPRRLIAKFGARLHRSTH